MFYLLEALFIFAPSYVWRFKLGPLPLNVLEVLIVIFWLAFAGWIYKTNQVQKFWEFCKNHSKIFLWATGLFFLASIISTIISPAHQRAAGLFIVYFFQPIITYFPAAYILQDKQKKYHFIKMAIFLAGLYGIYAVVQYYTLIGVPPQWWGNTVEPKRALAVFEYPNAFALWLAPLLAFAMPFLFDPEFKAKWLKLFWIFGVGGLIFSLSRSGWAGLFAAAVAFAILYINKNRKVIKYLLIGLIPIAIIIYALPNLRYRLILPFKGDKSTLSRVSLWHTAGSMLKESPVLGEGLYGFRTLYYKFSTDSLTPAYDYPHNIFLNFWVETGLLGLLSFLVLNGYLIIDGLKNRGNIFKIALILFIIEMFVHGLADAPYFLNVLALEYWMILALAH